MQENPPPPFELEMIEGALMVATGELRAIGLLGSSPTASPIPGMCPRASARTLKGHISPRQLYLVSLHGCGLPLMVISTIFIPAPGQLSSSRALGLQALNPIPESPKAKTLTLTPCGARAAGRGAAGGHAPRQQRAAHAAQGHHPRQPGGAAPRQAAAGRARVQGRHAAVRHPPTWV